jgi:hypothetical protein
MTPIFLLMLFPILTIIVMKVWRPQQFSWLEAGTQFVLSLICISALYMGGKYMEMTSVQFLTGTINSKTSADGHYTTSYCCATDSKGNCTSTCYTDHYTREWFLKTTIGNIETSSIDTEWRSSRDSFSSDKYWNGAYKGEACSRTDMYLNYVQAAKFSLHNRSGTNEEYVKAGLLPNYPQIHGIYKLNRVIDLGVGIPNLDKWRLALDDHMKTLGGLKQINIFIMFVPTTNPSYTAALEAHWRGANKNDTIIVVGMDKANQIVGMIDVITWAKSATYKINLIAELTESAKLSSTLNNGVIDHDGFLKTVRDITMSDYDRRPMEDFIKLKHEIDPPFWVLVLCLIFAVPGSLGLALLFDRIDLDAKVFGRSRISRYRR